jgi:hypothetical protein
MKSLFASPLLLAAATVAPAEVTVQSATGDWKTLPQLTQKGYDHLSEKAQAKLFEIAEAKSCPAFLLNQGRLNFRIGFAVQYDSAGALTRLLLPKLDCPEAEGVAGGALLEMLQGGDYAPTGKSSKGWYQGTLGFSFAGKNARDPAERIEEIGSRLASHRVCMTRAEWAQRRKDDREAVERAQTQRGCKADTECGT